MTKHDDPMLCHLAAMLQLQVPVCHLSSNHLAGAWQRGPFILVVVCSSWWRSLHLEACPPAVMLTKVALALGLGLQR